MDGLFYVLRSGLPWRMLPRDFPPVSTVQRYFYAWAIAGSPDDAIADCRMVLKPAPCAPARQGLDAARVTSPASS